MTHAMDHWNATGKMALDQRGRDNLDRIDTAVSIARDASDRLDRVCLALQTDSDLMEAARLLSNRVIEINDELENRADPSGGWGSTETGASTVESDPKTALFWRTEAFDRGLGADALDQASDHSLDHAETTLHPWLELIRSEQRKRKNNRSVPSGQ